MENTRGWKVYMNGGDLSVLIPAVIHDIYAILEGRLPPSVIVLQNI